MTQPDYLPWGSAAKMLACSERTINFHLANATGKSRADNKLAAVKRACGFGLS